MTTQWWVPVRPLTDAERRASGPFVRPLTAAGAFDEDKHPRDAHGRFAGSGEAGVPEGWTVRQSDDKRMIEERTQILMRQGVTREAAERDAKFAALMHGQRPLDAWKSPDGKATIRFYDDANLTQADKVMIANRVDELSHTNPLPKEISVGVGTARDLGGSIDSDVFGEHVASGNYSHITVNSDLFHGPPGADLESFGDTDSRFITEDTGTRWFSQAEMSTHPADYVMTHEWGHALEHVGRYDETDRPQIAEALRVPGGSGYSRTGDNEAYAEAFAEYHLTGGKTTDQRAQALAKIEGWK